MPSFTGRFRPASTPAANDLRSQLRPISGPRPGWALSGRVELLAAALLGALPMAVIQASSPHLLGNDSYYHAAMAGLLGEAGFVQSFPWLHWTLFRDQFVSHHHGFHVLLAPYVWLSEAVTGDAILGAKVAITLCMGATAAMFCLVLRALGVRRRLWWMLLLLCLPWAFWLRLSFVRAPSAGLPMMLAAVWLVLRHRPVWLGVLAFCFSHLYGAALLLPLIPLSFLGGHILAGTARRRTWTPLIACLLGGALGMVIHPYFPQNLTFLKMVLLEIGMKAPEMVAGEWRPMDGWLLCQMAAPLLAVWLICLIRRLRCSEPIDGVGLGLLLLNLGFLALTFKSRRFIEYWPMMALLNAVEMGRHAPAMRTGPLDAIERWFAAPFVRGRLLLLLVAVVSGLGVIHKVRSAAEPSQDLAAIEAGAQFLKANSPPGALLFADDWDSFPAFFFYNRHNTYVAGLDPVFTQRPYPALWERYQRIVSGQAPESLDDIADQFGAAYVAVMRDHPEFYRQLRARADRFERIYPAAGAVRAEQPSLTIFRVRSESSGAAG